jgi:hypothetical protein
MRNNLACPCSFKPLEKEGGMDFSWLAVLILRNSGSWVISMVFVLEFSPTHTHTHTHTHTLAIRDIEIAF